MLKRRMALVWISVVILLGSWLTMPVAVAEDAATGDLDLGLEGGYGLLLFAEELFGPGSEEVTFGQGLVYCRPAGFNYRDGFSCSYQSV